MGTKEEVRRGWGGWGWGQATPLQPSALFPCSPLAAWSQRDQPHLCLPAFLWTYLAQMPQGGQPLERRREGVRC